MRVRPPAPPPGLASPPETVTLLQPRRRVRRLRRGGRRLLLVAAVAALVGAVAWAGWWSPLLAVQEVRVVGAERDLAREVGEAAAVPLGMPLPRVDTEGVAARVEALPAVAAVAVRPGGPRTLTIEVVPRKPVALLIPPGQAGDLATAQPGPLWQLVDAEGVPFGQVDPADRDHRRLPRLWAAAPPAGEAATWPTLQAGAAVAAELPPGLRDRVGLVEAPSPAGVELVLRDGTRVGWGEPGDAERKLAVLRALLATPAQAYDVSVPERPTFRP